MVGSNVATLGEVDSNYGKLQNVEFEGIKNYMGIISSKLSLSSLPNLTGLWVYLLYSNFFPYSLIKPISPPPKKTTSPSLNGRCGETRHLSSSCCCGYMAVA